MTGWRVGWMVLPEDLVRPVECLAQNLFISAPHVSQVAAEAAFDCHDELLANVAVYRRNRDRLLSGLPQAGFTRLSPAEGAFYVYADVSDRSDDSAALCARLLAETISQRRRASILTTYAAASSSGSAIAQPNRTSRRRWLACAASADQLRVEVGREFARLRRRRDQGSTRASGTSTAPVTQATRMVAPEAASPPDMAAPVAAPRTENPSVSGTAKPKFVFMIYNFAQTPMAGR